MDNETIIEQIQAGKDTKQNLTLIYKNNGGLIGLCTRPYRTRQDIDDIEQEAFIALADACKDYNPDKGTFAHYAIKRIKWHLIRYTSNQNAAHIPQGMIEDIQKYKQITAAGSLTDIEICQRLKITPKQLEDIRRAITSQRAVSIYTPIDESEKITLEDTISDDHDDIAAIDTHIDNEILRDNLNKALEDIKPAPAAIARMIYFDNMTVAEVSRRCNISYSKTAVLKNNALKSLRYHKTLRSLYYNGDQSRFYRGSLTSFKNTYTSVTEREAIKLYEQDQARYMPIYPE